ncbi:RNA 3'-terminal phosphate cyclase [Massilia sp. W12]|uniref:RNA 3'-terminal phosphate cyclase n=1 Tax=Massilia sp. W12 TaxID=3126507 RepID=UPI0030CD22CA
MIELDGSQGEGGGQILRSALALAMVTQTPFRIRNIRAGRSKPGLLRQHLVAVQAAAEVCSARTSPLALGASELEFYPGRVRGGAYQWAIGSAGSAVLVLQTVLPALLFADAPSQLCISGGTHNGMAPPLEFLQQAFLPRLAEMGAQVQAHASRYGFYPAGGGVLHADIQPCSQLAPREWLEPGPRVQGWAEAICAALPLTIAERELETLRKGMNWQPQQLHARSLSQEEGPGNILLLTLQHANTTEVFSALGEKQLSSEQVAQKVLQDARRWCISQAAVSEYLADQLMLPLALAGGGAFSCDMVSAHSKTNAEVISRFLPVQFSFTPDDKRYLCQVFPA